MNVLNRILIITFFACITGCGSKQVGLEEYLKTANDPKGPFCISKEQNRYRYSLFLRTPDFFAAQEGVFAGTAEYNKIFEKYKKAYYFLMIIEQTDSVIALGSLADPEKKRKLISEDISGRIKLLISGNKVTCSGTLCEGVNKFSNSFSVLIAFPAEIIGNKLFQIRKAVLQIEDIGLNTGTIKINCSKLSPLAISLRRTEQ